MSTSDATASDAQLTDAERDDKLIANVALKYLNAQLSVNHDSATDRYNTYGDRPNLPEERSAYGLGRILK